jgi:cell division protein FtsW
MKAMLKFFYWFFVSSEESYDNTIDNKILFAGIILIAIGIVMVYSASIAYAANDATVDNQYYFLVRHLGYVSVGVVAGIICFNTPTSFWKRYAVVIAAIVILLLIAVLVPHLGKMANGARRWIGIGFLHVQPSEFAKLSIAIYMADYVSKRDLTLKHFCRDLYPPIITMGVFMLLLLLEPDMGSSTVVFIVALSILYLSNLDRRFILGLSIIGAIGFVALVIFEPYRLRRVLGFVDPWQDALGKGYQLTHSLLAVGHGGWFGVGLGNSIEKLFYLPEAQTDFILAIIAEEFGFVGVMIILLLFWVIFYRGFIVLASETRTIIGRKFQALLAQGISLWFFAQALVNVGVIIGILPTKGLTLPFISFGGSSILVSCIALAILLKIDYENKQIRRGVEIL